MIITEERMQEAKEEAIEFLEYSVLSLCYALGVGIDGLTSEYEIPVGNGSPDYRAYESLLKQVKILESLQ